LKPTTLTIGKIVGTHGIKGEVKIVSLTDFPARFRAGLSVFISPPLPNNAKLEIERVRIGSKNILIKFKEIDDCALAETLRGSYLQVSTKEAQSLPKNTYWEHEIIGLEVITIDDEIIGRVTDILRTGSNDVYVVTSEKGELLIPAIKEIVKKIDLKNGCMLIEPMQGLLE